MYILFSNILPPSYTHKLHKCIISNICICQVINLQKKKKQQVTHQKERIKRFLTINISPNPILPQHGPLKYIFLCLITWSYITIRPGLSLLRSMLIFTTNYSLMTDTNHIFNVFIYTKKVLQLQ